MKTTPAAALVCAGILLGLPACGKNAAAKRSADAKPRSAERLISIAPSNTEIIVALGAAGNLIAVDTYSRDIPGVAPTVTPLDFLNPDPEILISLQPDLIIANNINQQGSGSEPLHFMEEMGARVVYIPVSDSLEGIMGDIARIAGILGREAAGEALVAGMRAELARVDEAAKRVTTRRTVYFEVEPAPHAVTFGKGVFLNEMIERVGAANLFAGMDGFFVVSGEEVIARNPDVILTNASELADPVAELYARAGFEHTAAHKQKRVFFISANESARPSHHVIKALKQIAVCVYPEYYAADAEDAPGAQAALAE